MISIITGPRKNVGDFLIADRAKKLLAEFVDKEIKEINRADNIDKFLADINQSDCLILCGGPAYTKNIYPDIYPLQNILDEIKVPIIPFGLGWCGQPRANPRNFSFSDLSLKFLKKIHASIEISSCRDIITKGILNNHGFKNVEMTGCPVWYDLDSIGKPFIPPGSLKKIVITTPASQKYLRNTIGLIQLITSQFKNSQIYLSFHRGIFPGIDTPPRKGLAYTIMAVYGKMKRFKIKDVSGGVQKISFYDQCDFHIGYRVHAHLYFLSKRKPSILINEDGRGEGMVKSMGLPNFFAGDSKLIPMLERQVIDYLENEFIDFIKISNYLDETFHNKMVPFLNTMK